MFEIEFFTVSCLVFMMFDTGAVSPAFTPDFTRIPFFMGTAFLQWSYRGPSSRVNA
jgi:hypothetical protein